MEGASSTFDSSSTGSLRETDHRVEDEGQSEDPTPVEIVQETGKYSYD